MKQGGHGTGKTGNLVLFPDRENTGNFVVTQGKCLRHGEIFLTIFIDVKSMFLFIFSNFFGLTSLCIISRLKDSYMYYFYQYIDCPTFLLYRMCYKYQTNLLRYF